MLSGTHLYTVDPKGRLVIPQAFAAELGASFVLTRAPGRCLLALPRPRWVRFLRGFGGNRPFRTFFLSGAKNVTLADANRIHVPGELRDWATLQRGTEVAIAGIGSAVVICPRDRWEARLLKIEQDLLAALASPERPLCTQDAGAAIRTPV